MTDKNLRLRITITSWHDWQPFGLSEQGSSPSFGIELLYQPAPDYNEITLALETCSIDSEILALNLRSALFQVHEAAAALGSIRMNELPYQNSLL